MDIVIIKSDVVESHGPYTVSLQSIVGGHQLIVDDVTQAFVFVSNGSLKIRPYGDRTYTILYPDNKGAIPTGETGVIPGGSALRIYTFKNGDKFIKVVRGVTSFE